MNEPRPNNIKTACLLAITETGETWIFKGTRWLRGILTMLPAEELGDVAEYSLPSHGRTCLKVPHVGDGYMHDESDDSPYDVDGVYYCGRCHYQLAACR